MADHLQVKQVCFKRSPNAGNKLDKDMKQTFSPLIALSTLHIAVRSLMALVTAYLKIEAEYSQAPLTGSHAMTQQFKTPGSPHCCGNHNCSISRLNFKNSK